MTTAKPITFTASDGYTLGGSLFEPAADVTCGVLISAGTGFPQHLYARLATYLAERGARVLTFDYRGIGASRPKDLAALKMDYADWGRLDQNSAALELRRLCPDLPLYHIGHSVGALHLGFAENQHLFTRHAFIGAGTGSMTKHHRWFVPSALTLWYLVGPWHMARQGYVAKGRWWKGEDLPAGVYRDWRRWCHRRDYFEGELDQLLPHHFAAVTAPIQSWTFTDDPIATPRASRSCLDLYPKADSHLMVRKPKDIGAKKVGHSGAFSSRSMGFWPEVWAWLEKGYRPNSNDMGASGRAEDEINRSARLRAIASAAVSANR